MRLPRSERLAVCAAWVPEGTVLADVGCDHGYLGIGLLLDGKVQRVLACDLRPGPLEQARKNAERFGVRERMDFFLCDGLTGLAPGSAQCIVIAGMGGETIAHILSQAPWAREATLILQPQSSAEDLRMALGQMGFSIARETIAREGKFLYPVILAEAGATRELPPGEAFCSQALLESGSPDAAAYLDRQIAGLEKAVHGLAAGAEPERLAWCEQALSYLKEKRNAQ